MYVVAARHLIYRCQWFELFEKPDEEKLNDGSVD